MAKPTITLEEATRIVRNHVNKDLTVTSQEELHGGMVNTVVEWATDGDPTSIVAKIADEPYHEGFTNEFESLAWYKAQTSFLVPKPYALISDKKYPNGTYLLIEKVKGRNLGSIELDVPAQRHFQKELAFHVAALHKKRRDTYGKAYEPLKGIKKWVDIFGPRIDREYQAVKEKLSKGARDAVGKLISQLDDRLPEYNQPTLVHGDLWATNIMVDDYYTHEPVISAFVDGGANFAEVEYELAYLRVFHTADETFFEEYAKRHNLRPGFDERCRIYWLNTMMLHARKFGSNYIPACERLAADIARMF